MIELDVADLVLIAGPILGVSTDAALVQLDIVAAQAALAEAQRAAGSCRSGETPTGTLADRAVAAAAGVGLIHALLQHRPFPGHGEQVAAAAALQFLAVNGWRADLDPPEAAASVIEDLASGQLNTAYAAAWLSPRLSPRSMSPATEAAKPAQLPGLRSRAAWIIRTQVAAIRPQRTPGIHTPATGFIPFTDHARDSIQLAMQEARRGDGRGGPEYLLLGLAGQGEGLAAQALGRLGISPGAVRQQVGQITTQAGEQARPGPHPPPAACVVQEVVAQAIAYGLYYIDTEHLLLAVVRAGGSAAQALARLGAGESEIRGAITALRAESGRRRSA